MNVQYGDGKTEFGPGVSIDLSGDELATAVAAYLVAAGVHVNGPRTVMVNGEPCRSAQVYVDPSGFVVVNGEHLSGRGPRPDVPFLVSP